MACNQLLGNYDGVPWGNIVKMDRTFALKRCQVRLVDPRMRKYYYDIKTISAAIGHLAKQEKSVLAHKYLDFAYDMANNHIIPMDDDEIDEANRECDEFFAKHKNSAS